MTLSAASLDDLRPFLRAHGYRIEDPNPLRYPDNEVTWYAYRPGDGPDCECNDKPPSLIVLPYKRSANPEYESVMVEIRGEANGVWWMLNAYSLRPGEVLARLDAIERALLAAWAALPRDGEAGGD